MHVMDTTRGDGERGAGARRRGRWAEPTPPEPGKLTTVGAALDYAIRKEEASHRFYVTWRRRLRRRETRDLFENLAFEEEKHRVKLEKAARSPDGVLATLQFEEVPNLQIADYVRMAHPHGGLTYQEALRVGMRKEAASLELFVQVVQHQVAQ